MMSGRDGKSYVETEKDIYSTNWYMCVWLKEIMSNVEVYQRSRTKKEDKLNKGNIYDKERGADKKKEYIFI